MMKKTMIKIYALWMMACIFFAAVVNAAEINPVDLDTEVALVAREAEARLPIIMYHLVTEQGKYIGKYGIRPAELEADLLWLADNGYTTVVMADVINFVQRGAPLPEKPIVLTFDDGNRGDIEYVLPLLMQYDMKAVFSIIGEATDKYSRQRVKYPNAKYPNLAWCDVKTMHESGFCEIQSHGYNVHGKHGAGKKRGESTQAYHTRLVNDLQKLQEQCIKEISFTPTTFTYPLGIFSEGTQEVLEAVGFVASLSCQEGMNVLKPGDNEKLFRLHRSNRPSGVPIKALIDAMEK